MDDSVVDMSGKPVDNVVQLDVATLNDIPVDDVLEAAKSEKLSQVIILGSRDDGSTYYASSTSDIAEMLLQIEIFKRQILEAAIA